MKRRIWFSPSRMFRLSLPLSVLAKQGEPSPSKAVRLLAGNWPSTGGHGRPRRAMAKSRAKSTFQAEFPSRTSKPSFPTELPHRPSTSTFHVDLEMLSLVEPWLGLGWPWSIQPLAGPWQVYVTRARLVQPLACHWSGLGWPWSVQDLAGPWLI